MTRRQALAALGGALAFLAGVPLSWSLYNALRFPSDRTPEGAYLRIALAFSKSRLEDCFPYLETESQHALFSIHEYRKKSLDRIRTSFDDPERSRLLNLYGAEGDAPGPPEVWAVVARQRGWDTRMRRDLSGLKSTEIVGDRATIVTAQGTRYPFRRAENGIWGLTIFSADLVAHRDRTARDYALVEKAAIDFDRAKQTR